jgi:hypothetical protein
MKENRRFLKNAADGGLKTHWGFNTFTVSHAWEFGFGSSSLLFREARASPSRFPIWRLGSSRKPAETHLHHSICYYPNSGG